MKFPHSPIATGPAGEGGLQNALQFTKEINIDFATRRSKSDFSNGALHDLKHRSDNAENKHQISRHISRCYIYFSCKINSENSRHL